MTSENTSLNKGAVRPGLSTKWIYAIGQLGWSLTSFAAINLLPRFYFPPEETGSTVFPEFIFTGAILGVLTTLGLVNFGGRIFDGITDPLIANWSDRKSHKMGKRKFMMALAIVPFALFSFLIFYPLSLDNFAINTTWLFITLFLFFFSMTLYVVPYTALIGELGHHKDDRLSISTIISVTWALGFMIGNSIYAVFEFLQGSYEIVVAFQLAIGGFTIIGFLAMLVPILFLNENKYAVQQVAKINILESLKTVFSNRKFKIFAISDLFYWLSLTFIQTGISFFITILVRRPESDATSFLLIGFVCSLLLYLPLNILAKDVGKKKILLWAFAAFAVCFLLIANYHHLGDGNLPFYSLAVISAFPLAAFGILPNAIIADIIYEDDNAESQTLAGMFYGARNFMMKMGVALANLIFPSLLILGKSSSNPRGIILIAYVAVFFCLVGFLVFRKYEEKTLKVIKPLDN